MDEKEEEEKVAEEEELEDKRVSWSNTRDTEPTNSYMEEKKAKQIKDEKQRK